MNFKTSVYDLRVKCSSGSQLLQVQKFSDFRGKKIEHRSEVRQRIMPFKLGRRVAYFSACSSGIQPKKTNDHIFVMFWIP
jgi:hypothetical protein